MNAAPNRRHLANAPGTRSKRLLRKDVGREFAGKHIGHVRKHRCRAHAYDHAAASRLRHRPVFQRQSPAGALETPSLNEALQEVESSETVLHGAAR
jgi:hypothetical protein